MVRKKEEQKIIVPDYEELSRMKNELKNEVQNTIANGYNGLASLAEEYRGRRGCRKIERRLLEAFICNDVRATVEIEGLGTYTAEVGDIQVAMDKDKEPCPMVAVWVFRGNGEDLVDTNPDVVYGSGWGCTMLDAVDSVVEELFSAVEYVYNQDLRSLASEKKGR